MRKELTICAILALAVGVGFAAPQAATPAPAAPAAQAAPATPADAAAKVAVPAAPKIAKVGEAAPDFTLEGSDGKTIKLSELKGKVVVLEWINMDCPIDKRVIESKFISTVSDKFKDKVTWLAVDSTAAHTKDDHLKTVSTFTLKYPVLNDSKGVVGKVYDAKTTPQIYIINTEGKLVYNGAIDDDPDGSKTTRVNFADKALTELLDGKTISISESKPYGCSIKW